MVCRAYTFDVLDWDMMIFNFHREVAQTGWMEKSVCVSAFRVVQSLWQFDIKKRKREQEKASEHEHFATKPKKCLLTAHSYSNLKKNSHHCNAHRTIKKQWSNAHAIKWKPHRMPSISVYIALYSISCLNFMMNDFESNRADRCVSYVMWNMYSHKWKKCLPSKQNVMKHNIEFAKIPYMCELKHISLKQQGICTVFLVRWTKRNRPIVKFGYFSKQATIPYFMFVHFTVLLF